MIQIIQEKLQYLVVDNLKSSINQMMIIRSVKYRCLVGVTDHVYRTEYQVANSRV